MIVQPYLHFSGCCAEAVRFYADVLGATIHDLIPYSNMPPGGGPDRKMPPGDHIMYGCFTVGDTMVMASDGCTAGEKPSGFELAVSVDDVPEAERVFAALSAGGGVRMPLTETFFSPRFGQLTDRFGVAWMVIVRSTPPKK